MALLWTRHDSAAAAATIRRGLADEDASVRVEYALFSSFCVAIISAYTPEIYVHFVI